MSYTLLEISHILKPFLLEFDWIAKLILEKTGGGAYPPGPPCHACGSSLYILIPHYKTNPFGVAHVLLIRDKLRASFQNNRFVSFSFCYSPFSRYLLSYDRTEPFGILFLKSSS